MEDGSSSNSSSSGSSSSSLSSSGSSSSGSESSSAEEKCDKPKTLANNMNTRRRSLETKAIEKGPIVPATNGNNKRSAASSTGVNSNYNPRVLRNNTASSDEDPQPSKKTVKTVSAVQKRKNSASNAFINASVSSTPKHLPQQKLSSSSANDKSPINPKSSSSNNSKLKNHILSKVLENNAQPEKKLTIVAAATTNVAATKINDNKQSTSPTTSKKNTLKTHAKLSTINPAIAANMPKIKKNTGTVSDSMKKNSAVLKKKESVRKSSDESEMESDSDSNEESSTSSESEATSSSNSYSYPAGKISKTKRTPLKRNSKTAQTDSDEDETTPRKLTRSFSSRVNKQLKKEISHTESTTEGEEEKNAKNRNRKSDLTNGISSKNNLERRTNGGNSQTSLTQLQSMSPPCLVEKKCPIEGCDSSGHLSGNLERHFLPDACPIYHNMSASECKERANERKIRNDLRCKFEKPSNLNNATGSVNSQKSLTPDQSEFLAKIHESRSNFKPIPAANDKVQMDREYTDEDREPNLVGFVPDYDLQLFREAQALASQKIESEVKDLQVGKGIKYITMGKYKMKVWYQSPYPDDAARLPQMYICEFCLRYQKSETSIKRHAYKCVWRHPPGDEIYRKGKLQVWQVDGKRQKQYCQHLCLLAKFFLDHKTLYYDVEPFLFYIMTLADVDGCHTVGYFSKEKNSFYNVSCILTLPPYQRKGYGRLLIDFSYLLTRVEGKIGSPEKPLSDLGLISYRSYWKDVLLDYLCNRSGSTLSIKDVSQEMAIYSYDIVSTLQALGMMKYWKGKHIVLKKQDVLDEYAERVKRRGTFPKIDEGCLRWNPFVPTQNSTST